MRTPTRARTAGYERGKRLSDAIRHNLRGFRAAVDRCGRTPEELHRATIEAEHRLPADVRAELEGMADGAGVSYQRLLAFARFEEVVPIDGCTVAVAAGDAAESGDTVFFKQSDKEGSTEYVGEDSHHHQQINVVRAEHPPDLNGYVGVTAAGSTALKMGLNEAGVAIGSNFGHAITDDAADADLGDRAVSRGEYMRQGLLHGDSAIAVAQHVASLLLAEPMSSPGNITIADASRAIVLEADDTHLGSEWVDDDLVVRTNRFEVLDQLVPDDETIRSSRRRFDRASAFLEERRGSVTVETMRDLATDHANGPGPDSICRHRETDYTDPTSLSSAVFALDGEDPSRSTAFVALGTPCHAWRSEEGWLRLRPTDTTAEIPEPFLTGDAWIDHYAESPREGEPSAERADSHATGPGS